MPRIAVKAVFIALLGASLTAARAELDFNRDIKPILSENCYFCHGPDEKGNKAELRLDSAEAAREVIASGELLHRITSDDPDERMPPPEAKIALEPRERELLKQWLDAGAEYELHWAFVPPEKAELDGDGNPIDQIVARHHAERNLEPTPIADPATLLRRVTLDLTGLPPKPQDVAAFVADASPANYEKQIERLLASPAYGERMAWDWLDAARYADSNGYQGDNERTMWPWRDWAVDAFNKNLPYDEFTIYQIAGDLFPGATFEQKLATGFLRNHAINGEGGRIPEENRVDYVYDMTETVGTVWLGLTLQCCRCHDHKFDPLPQKEYFQLTAYFNQTPVNGGGGNAQTPPVLPVPEADQQSEFDAIATQLSEISANIVARETHLAKNPPPPAQRGPWSTLIPATAEAKQTLTIQPNGTILAGGDNPNQDTYTVTSPTDLGQIAAIRLDALPHASMTAGGLARSDSANFVLTEFEIYLRRSGEEKGTRLEIASAEATHEQGSHAVKNAFDGNKGSGWAVLNGQYAKDPQSAVFRLKEPVKAGADSRLAFILRHDSRHPHHNIGQFRLSVSSNPGAPLALDAKPIDPEIAKLATERDKLTKRRTDITKSTPKVMVMEDMDKPRKTYVLDVGNYAKRLDEVDMATPAVLPPMPENYPRNRLGLAKWIVANDNPLTARVTVNRIWQMFFGIGIVKTAEDFGTQGETAEMQDLLDHLAVAFREGGWDLKDLVKTIVTSDAYRRSSRADNYAEDPDNRLLTRGPRLRMPSWMIRDSALAASGLLVDKLGGRPVNTYQPEGIWEEASFGKKRYTLGKGEDLHRRSLYTFWRRIIAPPAFFDNAGRTVCSVNPFRTNTPLHALYTLNETTFVEAARHLAQRTLSTPATRDIGRISFVFNHTLSRSPSDAEAKLLLAQLKRSREQFREQPDSAIAFLNIGQQPRDKSLDQTEHAAWTALCLAVLNLDEAVTKE